MEEEKDGMGEVKGKDKERWRTNEEEEQRKKKRTRGGCGEAYISNNDFFFVFLEFCFFTRSDR